MPNMSTIRFCQAFIWLIAGSLAACAASEPEYKWPEKTIGINQIRPTQRIQTSMLIRGMERSQAATVVLRMHVDEEGKVKKSIIQESSGNTEIDGAAKRAMRKMTFFPYIDASGPIPVTVITPIHFPAIN